MQTSGLEKAKVNLASFEYDFAVHGGAVGDITLANDVLPDDAIVMDGVIEVKTALVGSGATVALKVLGTDDILAATAITSFTLAAILDVVPVGTAATMIKMTAKGNMTMSVAVAALTAGRFVVHLKYVLGV